MRYLCVVFLIVAIAPVFCSGQEIENLKDTVKTDPVQIEDVEEVVKDSARLAVEARSKQVWKRSLILPGWGQVTNGGFWWLKVPVIYGGFVTGILVFDFNQRYYKEYLAEAQYRYNNNDAAPPWSPYQRADKLLTTSMVNAKDYHRRNRDLTVLLMVGWWALNAVEAYTSDMLKNRWSIADDLSAKVVPTLIPLSVPGGKSPMLGLKVQIDIGSGL